MKNSIKIGVSALIFNDEQKVLLSLRGPKARNERGKWEIPGGEVMQGEELEAAVKREVMEEVGVAVEVIKKLHTFDHTTSDQQHWISHTFICRISNGLPKVMEPGKSEKMEWFTVEEAMTLPLADVTQDDFKVLKIQKGVDKIELPYA